MADDLLLYVGQKAFIEREGKLLILKQKGLNFPGGRIKSGETDFTASLKREVLEETGLEIEVCDAFITWQTPHRQNEIPTGRIIYLVGFRCKYISGTVTLNDEHSDYMWINKEDYRSLTEDTDYYRALIKYFKD